MVSANEAKKNQDRKLKFVPVWPVVAAFAAVALLVWLTSR
jgi:type VI protein secretion system component VasF